MKSEQKGATMPILEIELVGDAEGSFQVPAAQALADAAAAVFGSPPGSTWVRLRILSGHDYAEDGGAERGMRPVFVRVLRYALPEADALREEVRALTAAVARICGLPVEQVHIVYEAPAAGRLAFGGALVD